MFHQDLATGLRLSGPGVLLEPTGHRKKYGKMKQLVVVVVVVVSRMPQPPPATKICLRTEPYLRASLFSMFPSSKRSSKICRSSRSTRFCCAEPRRHSFGLVEIPHDPGKKTHRLHTTSHNPYSCLTRISRTSHA